MRSIESILAEIEETKAVVKPLIAKLENLDRLRRDCESKNFIAGNKISKADVEMSSGEGKSWFGTAWEFGRWMRTHGCTKVWAEWNGVIYHAADLKNGKMPDMPGRVSDLD